MSNSWDYQIFWALIDENGNWMFHSAYDFVNKERFFEWLGCQGWEIEKISLSVNTQQIDDYEGIQKLWKSKDYDPFLILKKSKQLRVELHCKRPIKEKHPE